MADLLRVPGIRRGGRVTSRHTTYPVHRAEHHEGRKGQETENWAYWAWSSPPALVKSPPIITLEDVAATPKTPSELFTLGCHPVSSAPVETSAASTLWRTIGFWQFVPGSHTLSKCPPAISSEPVTATPCTLPSTLISHSFAPLEALSAPTRPPAPPPARKSVEDVAVMPSTG